MGALIAALSTLAAAPVFEECAAGAPTGETAQAQIARLPVEMSKNEEARRRIDSGLREMERRANELHVEQQRRQNECVRMQSEALSLQPQAR